ncbi:hypothetical protein HDV01_005788 [Terramyces sp. JEL0728]|nr:hypothetical protein HDV01_005788 [Terramyces sp. JEL0728]
MLIRFAPILINRIANAATPNTILTRPKFQKLIPPFPKTVIIKLEVNSSIFFKLVSTTKQLVKFILLGFGTAIRFTTLAFLYGPLIITFPPWFLMEYNTIMDERVPRLWWVEWMVWVIGTSGPTFTKLGQWASSRSDLFPNYICTELSKLQSNNRAHSFIHTRNTIESNFNQPLDELFAEFNVLPIGVGAIGQVYKAKLRECNQDVAVKVLHPYVRYLVSVDLKIMRFFASAIEYTVPNSHWLSLPEEVDMFASMMRAQLDLSVEADNLVLFGENFTEWDSVGFPQPFHKYVRKDILIENWVDGILMEKFLKWESCFDRQVATIGLTSFLVIYN